MPAPIRLLHSTPAGGPALVVTGPLPPSPSPRYPGELLALLARDHLAFFARLEACGDVAQLRLGAQRFVLFGHPGDLQRLLVTKPRTFARGRGFERATPLLGDAGLTADGARRPLHRRRVRPAIQRDRVAAYAAAMAGHAERATATWGDDTTLDVHEAMTRLTRAIIGKILFDLDVGDDPGGMEETIDLSLRTYRRALLPLGTLLERVPLPSVRCVQCARRRFARWLTDAIRARRTLGDGRDDLLTTLLRARDADGRALSDAELRDEILALLVAGHETAAVALTWTWYLLSQYPNVEERLHAELDAVLGDRLPEARDLPRLTYTRMVIAEAMRLYPPVWIVERRAVRDVEAHGYRVPAGSLVYASPYFVHRDPRWYERPDRFDPERWHPDRADARPRFAYFPLGGGTRAGIGEQFAWTVQIVVLATIARRWRLRLARNHPVALEPLATLRPKNGMRVDVLSRTSGTSSPSDRG
ncbi:MAG: cytochrome P450 [Gemmatimonadaceae bacterium]|nr:cytochrome P450 [Gemmatimonadaceae bacterium]